VQIGSLVDLFSCDAGLGTTDPIPPGSYNVVSSLLTSSGIALSMVNRPAVVGSGTTITNLGQVVFAINGATTGDAPFTWEIRVGLPTGPQGVCAAGELVELDFSGLGPITFACADLADTVTGLPGGTYSVTAVLKLNTTVESQLNSIPETIPPGGTATPQHIIFVVTQ
jgi:hypothetical protein